MGWAGDSYGIQKYRNKSTTIEEENKVKNAMVSVSKFPLFASWYKVLMLPTQINLIKKVKYYVIIFQKNPKNALCFYVNCKLKKYKYIPAAAATGLAPVSRSWYY